MISIYINPFFTPLQLALTFQWKQSYFFGVALSMNSYPSLYLQPLYRPIIMLLQTIQANHNGGSIRIQLEKSTGVFAISVLCKILLQRSTWRQHFLSQSYQSYRSVSNQASWLLSIRSWVWPRSGNGSVWWPRSGRVSVW